MRRDDAFDVLSRMTYTLLLLLVDVNQNDSKMMQCHSADWCVLLVGIWYIGHDDFMSRPSYVNYWQYNATSVEINCGLDFKKFEKYVR